MYESKQSDSFIQFMLHIDVVVECGSLIEARHSCIITLANGCQLGEAEKIIKGKKLKSTILYGILVLGGTSSGRQINRHSQ